MISFSECKAAVAVVSALACQCVLVLLHLSRSLINGDQQTLDV